MMDFLSGRFAELQGLPLHPLVVHLVVILVPLSAVAMLVAIAVPRWRPRLQWIALAGLVVGGVGTYLAKLSGDSLAAAVGLPTFHAEWGNNMVPLVAALMAGSGLWIWLNHLAKWRPARFVAAGVVSLLAVSSVAMTYVVGHSGAEAVWQDTLTEARQAPAAAEVTSPIPLAEVARHNTPEDCWTVVEGQVYDMTDFIARHPAGPAGVVEMCGVDATESFNGEHAGQAEPESWLAVFRIGELA
jgi:hypothetical protein